MIAHVCNPRMQKAEAVGYLCLQGWLGQLSEVVSQNKINKTFKAKK